MTSYIYKMSVSLILNERGEMYYPIATPIPQYPLLKAALDAQETQITTQAGQIDTLETITDDLQNQITVLQAEVDAIEGYITPAAVGFSVTAGTVTPKTLTVSATASILTPTFISDYTFGGFQLTSGTSSGILTCTNNTQFITPVSVQALGGGGFQMAAGSTSKTLQVAETMKLTAAAPGSTLDIGPGGTLVTSAYTDTTSAANITSGILAAARLPTATTKQFNVLGRTTDAPASYVGEILTSTVLYASKINLTSNTDTTITSITLTPGCWMVAGNVFVESASVVPAITYAQASLSLFTNQLDDPAYRSGASDSPELSIQAGLAVSPRYFSVATNTTVYLIGLAVFSVSTIGACGYIQAVRVH